MRKPSAETDYYAGQRERVKEQVQVHEAEEVQRELARAGIHLTWTEAVAVRVRMGILPRDVYDTVEAMKALGCTVETIKIALLRDAKSLGMLEEGPIDRDASGEPTRSERPPQKNRGDVDPPGETEGDCG